MVAITVVKSLRLDLIPEVDDLIMRDAEQRDMLFRPTCNSAIQLVSLLVKPIELFMLRGFGESG